MGTTMTSREFNRDVAAAKKAANDGPVTITDHGHRSHVLMTAEDYDRLSEERELVGDRLWARRTEDIELEIPGRKAKESRDTLL